MYSIWMDTATDMLFIALEDESEIIESVAVSAAKKHSETALLQLKAMLDKNRITPDQIDRFFTGVGPGSYSGVRISLTIAKMFQLSHRSLSIFGFSTLELLSFIFNDDFSLPAGKKYLFTRINGVDQLILRENIKHPNIFNVGMVENYQPIKTEILNRINVHELLDNEGPNYLREAIE